MLDPRLNHVVAVARSGSFTAAASEVGVTQSAVTKSIADLEQQVGYAIFHRSSRGATLTEEGRDFVDRAARLLADAGELLKRASGRDDKFAGVLRIGVCPASLEWILVKPQAALLARHPSVRLEVVGSSFERIVQQLRGGAIDVAFGFEAAFADWLDLRRESFAPLEAVLFVRKGHPILDRSPCTLADLADFEFISPSDSRPFGAVIRGLYEDQNVDWQDRVHIVDFFPSVRRIVAGTNAVAVVARSLLDTSPTFLDEFVLLEHLSPFPAAPLCCAVRSRWEPRPAVRAFISIVRESLEQA